MKVFDINRILINGYPYLYLLEVAFRSIFTFFVVYLFLRIIGRRGVRQMTLFEVVIILTLGSAAGDVALNQDSPLLPVIVTFMIVIGLYRFFTLLVNKSTHLQIYLEGKPIVLIREGELHWENAVKQSFAFEEFIMELRKKGITHLGQVRLALVEIDGNLSVYYYRNEEIKPGLPTLPLSLLNSFTSINNDGTYACAKCSHIHIVSKCTQFSCPRCGGLKWIVPYHDERVP
ncbi:TPA: DUF421 domain-containing protein [Yersinia enterocolitica]